MKISSILMVSLLAGAFGTGLTIPAQATVIDFNGLPASGQTVALSNPLITQGYRFKSSNSGFYGVTGALFLNASNGTPYLLISSPQDHPFTNDGRFTLSYAAGGVFNLLSFDAAASNIVKNDTAKGLQLTGIKSDNTQVSASFSFDGIIDGAGGKDDFQNLQLPGSFTSLTAVIFAPLNPLGSRKAVSYVIDNVRVQSTAVPEPASIGLFGFALALLCLGLTRRRTPSSDRIMPMES